MTGVGVARSTRVVIEEEWGVRYESGAEFRLPGEREARHAAQQEGVTLLKRNVSPWAEVQS